jgi:hypothetical protein
MRVYLAAAITNESRSIPTLKALLGHLERCGHDVPTRHIVEEDARARDAHLTDAQLADRDLAWLAASAALVAEVSTPSHGVGVEVTAALQRGLPVLLLYRHGTRVSRLLLGLSGSRARSYGEVAEATAAIDEFLNGL